MILSLNLRTKHGCPGWLDLSPEEKTKLLTFQARTNEQVVAYLGNYGHENDLPKGFAVQKRVLQKQPWCFGKQLYLSANGMKLQAINANIVMSLFAKFIKLPCLRAANGSLENPQKGSVGQRL